MNNIRVISVCKCKKQLGKKTFSLLYSRGIIEMVSKSYVLYDSLPLKYRQKVSQ